MVKCCIDDDKVDAGRGAGSCNNDCGCPGCAPFCSTSGYCQDNDNYGFIIAECSGHESTFVWGVVGGGLRKYGSSVGDLSVIQPTFSGGFANCPRNYCKRGRHCTLSRGGYF